MQKKKNHNHFLVGNQVRCNGKLAGPWDCMQIYQNKCLDTVTAQPDPKCNCSLCCLPHSLLCEKTTDFTQATQPSFVFSRYHCKELSLTVVWVTPPWDGEVSCKELYSSQLAGSALLQRVLEGTQASKGTKEEPFPAMERRMRVHLVLSRNSGVCRVTRKLHCISKMTK